MSEDKNLLDRKSWLSTKDKKYMYGAVAIIAVLFALFLVMKVTNPQKSLAPEPTLKPLSISNDLLGEDEFQKFKEALDTQNEIIASYQEKSRSLEAELESLKTRIDGVNKESASKGNKRDQDSFSDELNKFKKEAMSLTDDKAKGELSNFSYPPSPNVGQLKTAPSPIAKSVSTPVSSIPEETLVGGVGWVQGTPEPTAPKKKPKRYYLPPSFFPAKLLTGIDAMTSKQGKENEEVVFFRVDAPAVLPNQIKKDLSGCFVVANVHGNLAKERAQTQAVNLSCLSADGRAVIDEKVLGFATDNGDGKTGLAGNVVSKDGSKMAWLMAAAVVGELGNSVSLSSFEQINSPLGTTTVLDAQQASKQAAGAAIQSGAQAYKDVILEYIKQSGPVIEMGPLKEATIFIQEGVWLNIKERETDA